MKALTVLDLWHIRSVADVIDQLETGVDGLSSELAARRLQEAGPNELQTHEGPSWWSILFDQFRNVLIVILLIATVISAFVGHGVESVAIIVIVLFAVVLGFIQEYRAERAIESLRQMASPTATVLRDGEEYEIPAREVVPGDVVLLSTGDRIPADLRILESHQVQTEEAPLTGESTPVSKCVDPIPDPKAPVSDRKNMLYAGTALTRGRGRGIAVATGMATELGKIAGMLQTVEPARTPLQESLDEVGRTLGAREENRHHP